MFLHCANPNCPAEFLHLYEGEWIVLELPGRTLQRYWLCGACSPSLRVIYNPSEGVKLIPRDMLNKSQQLKPAHAVDPSPKAA